MSGMQRRAFFRLRYPYAERPTLEVGDSSYSVTEISEGGMRIVLAKGQDLSAHGRHINGVVHFSDGQAVAISGSVRRSVSDEVAWSLNSGVSFRHMMAEQARLLRKYPALFNLGDTVN